MRAQMHNQFLPMVAPCHGSKRGIGVAERLQLGYHTTVFKREWCTVEMEQRSVC